MIYYIAHWDWILKNSRSDIVKELKNDFDITGITPLENHKSEIKNDYFQTINWNYKRKKLLDIKGIFNLRKLIKTFNNEDIIHIFTLKSLIIFLIGSLFTEKKGTVIASITGLGYLFAKSKLANILKLLLKPLIVFQINRKVDVVIFQNSDNRRLFLEFSNFKNRVSMIPGSGLNLNNISVKKSFNDPLKVIFVSRLLNEKGFAEYCEIANLLKEDSSFKFYIAGDRDRGNKSSISDDQFKNMKQSDHLNYLGEIDVLSELHNYDVLISPTHHEGFSRIILESAYIGLFIIANNIAGTREVLLSMNSGKLVNDNNVKDYINHLKNVKFELKELDTKTNRELIKINYSIESISGKIKEIYDDYI